MSEYQKLTKINPMITINFKQVKLVKSENQIQKNDSVTEK